MKTSKHPDMLISPKYGNKIKIESYRDNIGYYFNITDIVKILLKKAQEDIFYSEETLSNIKGIINNNLDKIMLSYNESDYIIYCFIEIEFNEEQFKIWHEDYIKYCKKYYLNFLETSEETKQKIETKYKNIKENYEKEYNVQINLINQDIEKAREFLKDK